MHSSAFPNNNFINNPFLNQNNSIYTYNERALNYDMINMRFKNYPIHPKDFLIKLQGSDNEKLELEQLTLDYRKEKLKEFNLIF